MATNYLNSSVIKVYPSGYRDPQYNYKSCVNSEDNLNEIASRLVSNKSYISKVDGDVVEFVIKGYLFKTTKSAITDLFSEIAVDNIIYASVTVAPITSTVGGVSQTYDTLVRYGGTTVSVLDDSGEFKGVYFSSGQSVPDGSLGLFIKTSDTIDGFDTYTPSLLVFKTEKIQNGSAKKSIAEEFTTTTANITELGSNLDANSKNISGVNTLSAVNVNASTYMSAPYISLTGTNQTPVLNLQGKSFVKGYSTTDTSDKKYGIAIQDGVSSPHHYFYLATSYDGDGRTYDLNNIHATTADTATNVSTNINGNAISSIFESNGTTVKNATTAEKVSGSAGTLDAYRHVWFSDSSIETERVYNDKFKYNPYNGWLTVGSGVEDAYSFRIDNSSAYSGNYIALQKSTNEKLGLVYRYNGNDTTLKEVFTVVRNTTDGQNGNGLKIGANGLTIIGGGESQETVADQVGQSGSNINNWGTEDIYVTADQEVKFLSNLNDGWGYRKQATLHADGSFEVYNGSIKASYNAGQSNGVGIEVTSPDGIKLNNSYIKGTTAGQLLIQNANDTDKYFTIKTSSTGTPAYDLNNFTAQHVASETGDSAGYRNVWFSHLNDASKLVHNANFQYNPATDTLKVGNVDGKASSSETVVGSIKNQLITDIFTSDGQGGITATVKEASHSTLATSAYSANFASSSGDFVDYYNSFSECANTLTDSFKEFSEFEPGHTYMIYLWYMNDFKRYCGNVGLVYFNQSQSTIRTCTGVSIRTGDGASADAGEIIIDIFTDGTVKMCKLGFTPDCKVYYRLIG